MSSNKVATETLEDNNTVSSTFTVECKGRNMAEAYDIQEIYISEIKPVIFFSKLMGLFPLKRNIKGVFMFKILSLQMFYSILVYILIGYGDLYIAYQRTKEVQTSRHQNETFDEKVFKYNFILFLYPHLIFYPFHWYSQPQIAKYLSNWGQFLVTYEQVVGKKLNLRLNRLSWLLVTMLPSISIIYIAIMAWLLEELSLWEAVLYAHLVSFILFNIGIWYLDCDAFINTAKELSSNFQNSITSELNDSVSAFRTLWLQLSQLTAQLGVAHGHTMLQILVLNFVTVLFSTYGLLACYNHQRFDTIFITLILHGSLWSVVLIIFCNGGYYVSQNVGSMFTSQVSELLNMNNPTMKPELDRFLQVISSNFPTVSLGGYVIINRNLLVSITATIVTYLVVLVQFSSQEDETNNNCTQYTNK